MSPDVLGTRLHIMEKCPVCGEELYENRDEKIVTLYQGTNYHFCSTDHRDEFEDQPGKYV